MRQLLVTMMLAASLSVAACAPEQRAATVAQYTDEVKQVIAALDAIHDQDSAMAAADAYMSLAKSAEALASQADAAEPAERKALSAKYFRAVEAGDVRIKQHMHKLMAYPAAVKYGHLEAMTGASP
jgi:hypothetical protein